MDIFEAIKGRRSVREFLPNEVSKEDLEIILNMARYAPTAANDQPWRFLVLRDREIKARLKKALQIAIRGKIEHLDLIKEEQTERIANLNQFIENIFVAPVLILVFVDCTRYPDLVMCDGAMAVLNMMLAAHALGYGSSFQTTVFPEDLIKEHFSIPNDHRFICAVPIGRPTVQPEMPEKKRLTSIVWEEQALA